MWLRDYLPKDAPNARILTWGYQSNLQADESTSILADFTNTFFQRLIYMREGAKCESRPIIFIGHSLGCLVIKKALTDVTSKGLNSHRLPVRAIIFLGAPHNGLASDSYKILETLVKGRVTQQLVTELKTDSPTLRDLSARFIPIAKEIEILTCYETMETKTVVQENGVWKREGEPMMMVAPSSAVMHGPTEKKIASSMDHSQLAKVKKGENGIYPDIKSIIRTALLSNAKIVATNESSPQDLHGNPKQRSKPEQSTKHDPETAFSSPTETLPSDRPIEVLPHDSEMVRALKSANVEMLKELCKNPRNLVMLDQDGYPPVCVAARFGLDNGLKTMLAAGASLTCSNREGEDPLILATDHQRRDTVATLLEHGAFVNVRGGVDDASALHYAVDRGDEDILRLLLENHADPNLLDSYDDSPLMCASRNGNIEAVELLLQYNADVNEAAQATPLMMAAEYGHADICKKLLQSGAYINTAQQPDGETALYLAARYGHADAAEVLLQYGADPYATTQSGFTHLMIASECGHLDVVNVLADYIDVTQTTDPYLPTALMLAAKYGHAEVCQQLLDYNVDINATQEPDGETALTLAAQYGHTQALIVLLNDEDNFCGNFPAGPYDMMPLMHAAMNGYSDVVQALLQVFNSPEESDANGWTALCYAAWFGHVEVAQQLLNAQADVEHETVNGDRPLHLAAKEGKIPLINLLLSYGANSSPSLLQLKKWDGLCFDDDVSYPTQQKVIGVLRLHEKLNNTRRSLKFWK
ncbi:hypothetical protein M1813_007436 [Neofusicoccum parvum]|uniref:Uncharacterized protein n=1 Tax=Neofusicoccum parvum TaxID=310453 RepID=A0ACB5SQ42_9PEZI|nr:hypothetical protein M1813_007436 [Neofusicoccum parvum]